MQNKILAITDFDDFSSVSSYEEEKVKEKLLKDSKYKYLGINPNGIISDVEPLSFVVAGYYHKLMSSHNMEETLKNLKEMMIFISGSSAYTMPINTSRVLLLLAKKVIKNKDDEVLMKAYLTKFVKACSGNPLVIQKILKSENLIEVPEDIPFHNQKSAWDDGVFDDISGGRKSVVQLILDAYIKGISNLTIYLTNPSTFEEVIRLSKETAAILDMNISYAIRCDVNSDGGRISAAIYLPKLDSAQDYSANLGNYAKFNERIASIQADNISNVKYLINKFNEEHRPAINREYLGHFDSDADDFHIQPISYDNLVKLRGKDRIDGFSLSVYVYEIFSKKLDERIKAVENRLKNLNIQFKNNEINESPLEITKRLLRLLETKKKALTPKLIFDKYFREDEKERLSKCLSLDEFAQYLPIFHSQGAKIVLRTPLASGRESLVKFLINFFSNIDAVALYNTHESYLRNINELKDFENFIMAINNKNLLDVEEYLKENKINENLIAELITVIRNNPEHILKSVLSSDSRGYTNQVPGMGFYSPSENEKELAGKNFLRLLNLPVVQYFDNSKGVPSLKNSSYSFDIAKGEKVCSLGKVEFSSVEAAMAYNFCKRAEALITNIPPVLRNMSIIATGFVIANLFNDYSLGAGYTSLWFSITAVRHLIADMVAKYGTKVSNWEIKTLDCNNIANSLFFTGLSIPILKSVDLQVDSWALSIELAGFAKSMFKFLALSWANGSYLYLHNRLRGMSLEVAKMNFFRAILSTPFSLMGSFLLDPILAQMIQNKIWSDFVAAVIEGSAKNKACFKDRANDYISLFKTFDLTLDNDLKKTAILDIIYIFNKQAQGKKALKNYIKEHPEQVRRMLEYLKSDKIISVFEDNQLHPNYSCLKENMIPLITEFSLELQKIFNNE